jgi:hypothetical protein
MPVQGLNLLPKVLQVGAGDAKSSDLPYKLTLFSLQGLHLFLQGLNGQVVVNNLFACHAPRVPLPCGDSVRAKVNHSFQKKKYKKGGREKKEINENTPHTTALGSCVAI